MTERLTRSACLILACSLLAGCSLTIGPKVENRAIIVQSGIPIECLDQVKVRAHVLREKGEGESARVFKQDVGGWIMMHPDHWKSVKAEIERLREKAGD